MVKAQVKHPNLGELQQAILIHLAENGSKTIRRTSLPANKGGLKKDYSNVHDAFMRLAEMGLIQKIGTDKRGYSLFWLTVKGIMLCLVYDVKPERILSNVDRFLEDNEEWQNIRFLVEASEIPAWKEFPAQAYYALERGNDPFESYLPMYLRKLREDRSQNERMARLMKKYPSVYAGLKKGVEEVNKNLDGLKRILKDER